MLNPSANICLKNHGKQCQNEPKIASTLIKIRPKSIQKASVETDLGERSSRKRPGANYSCFTGVLKPPSLNYSCFIGVLRRPSSIYSIFIVFKASPKALRALSRTFAWSPPGRYRGVLKLQFFIIFNIQIHTSQQSPHTHLGARRHGADLSCLRQMFRSGPLKDGLQVKMYFLFGCVRCASGKYDLID